jgi:hypothetical protein
MSIMAAATPDHIPKPIVDATNTPYLSHLSSKLDPRSHSNGMANTIKVSYLNHPMGFTASAISPTSIKSMKTVVLLCHPHGNNLYEQWRISTIIWYHKTIMVPIFKSI